LFILDYVIGSILQLIQLFWRNYLFSWSSDVFLGNVAKHQTAVWAKLQTLQNTDSKHHLNSTNSASECSYQLSRYPFWRNFAKDLQFEVISEYFYFVSKCHDITWVWASCGFTICFYKNFLVVCVNSWLFFNATHPGNSNFTLT